MFSAPGRPNFDPAPLIRFVAAYRRVNGYPPTLTDIASALNLSKSAVWYRVDCLCDLGILTRRRYGPRSIEVEDGS